MTVQKCAEWNRLFQSKFNDPVERSLRVIQFGGIVFAVSGFGPVAARISRFRDYLFCTKIIDDLIRGLNGDAFQWIGKKEVPSSHEEMRDLSYLVMDFFYPLLALAGAEQAPLIDAIVNVSWSTGNGLQLFCNNPPGMGMSALFDLSYSVTFLPCVALPPAVGDWLGLGSGLVFLGVKAWSVLPASPKSD
jgi:hypothetical protein